MQKIVTNLWFDTQAEEAARYYISIFGSGAITSVSHFPEGAPGEPGTVLSVGFELAGQHFVGINGGPEFTFTEAISLAVSCADQDEVDRFWYALSGDGGQESQCGWVKDKYGLSWQVVPEILPELLSDPDPDRAARAVHAMLGMRRLIIADLIAAADAA
jgi:predicted 3-demethylubiquinone-9 3-methyltransferase (glyoxalase superfamily)